MWPISKWSRVWIDEWQLFPKFQRLQLSKNGRAGSYAIDNRSGWPLTYKAKKTVEFGAVFLKRGENEKEHVPFQLRERRGVWQALYSHPVIKLALRRRSSLYPFPFGRCPTARHSITKLLSLPKMGERAFLKNSPAYTKIYNNKYEQLSPPSLCGK